MKQRSCNYLNEIPKGIVAERRLSFGHVVKSPMVPKSTVSAETNTASVAFNEVDKLPSTEVSFGSAKVVLSPQERSISTTIYNIFFGCVRSSAAVDQGATSPQKK